MFNIKDNRTYYEKEINNQIRLRMRTTPPPGDFDIKRIDILEERVQMLEDKLKELTNINPMNNPVNK